MDCMKHGQFVIGGLDRDGAFSGAGMPKVFLSRQILKTDTPYQAEHPIQQLRLPP